MQTSTVCLNNDNKHHTMACCVPATSVCLNPQVRSVHLFTQKALTPVVMSR